MWHEFSCTTRGAPLERRHPDHNKCAVVLEAVKDEPCGGRWRAILDRSCARPASHRGGSGRGNGLSGRTRKL